MITLQVNGQKRTYSEEELTAILEAYYSNKVEKPTEGKWFQVNPKDINRALFENERLDKVQEWTRKIILEAFIEVDNNPKYRKPFGTYFPKKTWVSVRDAEELCKIAKGIGDDTTDWVEQALEWAQRINNGESWQAVCNKVDNANCYRMIIWKKGVKCFVGGCRFSPFEESSVMCRKINPMIKLTHVVPSVVRRQK